MLGTENRIKILEQPKNRTKNRINRKTANLWHPPPPHHNDVKWSIKRKKYEQRVLKENKGDEEGEL